MSGELMISTAAQTDFIMSGSAATLCAALLLALLLCALSWKRIARAFSGVSGRAWVAALLLSAGFLAFRLASVPLTNRVYFDEDLYANMALNIMREGRSCMCNWGSASACYDCILNKAPAAHPFMMSVFFRLFGASRSAAFAYSAFASFASSVLIFLCAYLLFGKREAPALLSIVLLNLVPTFIVWSNTIAAEVTFVFLSLLAFLAMLVFLESPEDGNAPLFLFSALMAMAMQAKAETGLLFPLFYAFIPLLGGLRFLREKRFYAAVLLTVLLTLPYLLHVYIGATGSSWGATEGPKFSAKYFPQVFPVNSRFFLFGYPTIEHPFLFSLLAIAGPIFLVLAGLRRQAAVISLWFAAFFLLYCFFYAGSVRYGTDVRYTLSYYVPFVLAASAAGLFLGYRGIAVLSALLVVYFAVSFLPSVTTPAAAIEEARPARQYREFAETAQFPPNCTVVSHVSAIYLDRGIPSAQPWYLQGISDAARLRSRTSCIVFDYGYWCTVPPFEGGVCSEILVNYPDATKLASAPEGNFSYYLIPAR